MWFTICQRATLRKIPIPDIQTESRYGQLIIHNIYYKGLHKSIMSHVKSKTWVGRVTFIPPNHPSYIHLTINNKLETIIITNVMKSHLSNHNIKVQCKKIMSSQMALKSTSHILHSNELAITRSANPPVPNNTTQFNDHRKICIAPDS